MTTESLTTEIATTETSTPAPKKTRSEKVVKLSKKAAAALDAFDNDELELEEGAGKIAAILALYTAGVPKGMIIKNCGFNKVTVYRQCGELDKLKKAPALHFHGYELFEIRVQKYMKAKKVDRKTAVNALIEKDTNS